MEEVTEVWKDIKGFEDCYQVSNLGNVRSLDRYTHNIQGYKSFIKGRELAKIDNGLGYLYSDLHKNSKVKHHYIHRLVAEHFLDSTLDSDVSYEVNHIDHNKSNNCVTNLELISHKENMQKMFKHYNKNREQAFCIDCGVEVYHTSERCQGCNNLFRKTDISKLPIDKEDLYNLLLEESFDKVGKRFGINGNSIRKWCIKLGIPSKRSQYPKI